LSTASPSEAAVTLAAVAFAVVRVRGVRCDISVLLKTALRSVSEGRDLIPSILCGVQAAVGQCDESFR
jgi:hypothetical protein